MKNSKFKFLSTLFILVIVLALSACSNNDEDSKESGNDTDSAQQEINIRVTDDPDFLDPHLAEASLTFQMTLNMYDGLLATETDNSIKPAIAEDYEVSDDGLTYTFDIREDVMFHNGDPVTVEDIQYSFERLTGVDTDEPASAEFEGVESLDAPDESTFVINLKEIDSSFVDALTALNAAILPESNDEKHNDDPIGTGPFKFSNYSPGSELNLEKNPDYWQNDKPYLDKVNFKFQTDDDTAILAMEAGELDVNEIPAHKISEVEDDFNIVNQESNSVVLIALNNEQEPFDDVKVRQAMNYAISKDGIINSAFSDAAVKLGSHMSPAMGDVYLDGLQNEYDQDIEKAKELLAEAGYPDGFSTTITISSHRTMYSDIAQVAVENLKEIGVDAEIETIEWAIWLERVRADRDYDMTAINITGRPSAYEILNDYISTNSDENFFNYSNPEFDDLMDQALKEPKEEDQIEKYHEAQQLLHDEAAAVFMADNEAVWMVNPAIEGIKYYPYFFHDMSEVKFTE